MKKDTRYQTEPKRLNLNDLGQEVLSPHPIVLDVTPAPRPLHERIQEIVAKQLEIKAAEQGFETIEEANNFECDDHFEYLPTSEYELLEDEMPLSYAERDTAQDPAERAEKTEEAPAGDQTDRNQAATEETENQLAAAS